MFDIKDDTIYSILLPFSGRGFLKVCKAHNSKNNQFSLLFVMFLYETSYCCINPTRGVSSALNGTKFNFIPGWFQLLRNVSSSVANTEMWAWGYYYLITRIPSEVCASSFSVIGLHSPET